MEEEGERPAVVEEDWAGLGERAADMVVLVIYGWVERDGAVWYNTIVQRYGRLVI
jgi:hypothetical protein